MLPTIPVSLVVLGLNPGAAITGMTPGKQVAPTPPQKPHKTYQGSQSPPSASATQGRKICHQVTGLQREQRGTQKKDGVEMCLAFHLKGECYSNCAGKKDHHAHEAGETKLLQDFVKGLKHKA